MKLKGKKRLIANICFLFALILIFVMGLLIGTKFFPEKIKEVIYMHDGEKTVTLNVPGINQDGEGIMTTLTAKISHGSGQVLVNVNDVLAGYELQSYARTAILAAQNVTGTDMQKYDVSFSIKTNAGVIDGGSASAAMAVAVMAMLENTVLSEKVAMTGAIDASGKIIQVGLVDKKTEAARKANMSVMIVPLGQGSQVEQYAKEACNADKSYCEIIYLPYIEKTSAGIPVKEVATLEEAVKAMSAEEAEKIAREYIVSEPRKIERKTHQSIAEIGINLDNYSPAQMTIAGNNVLLKSNCTVIRALTTIEQASSIENGALKRVIGKPNTQDTASEIFDFYGIDIAAVSIDSYESGIFNGRLFAYKDGRVLSIESRPSDATALAARFDAPIYINNKVLEEQGTTSCQIL